MFPRRALVCCSSLLALAACGDDAAPAIDAAIDAVVDAAVVDAAPPTADAATIAAEGRLPDMPRPGFRWIDLGEVPLVEGETEDLAVEVGAEAHALFVVGVGPAGSFVTVTRAVDPAGAAWVSSDGDFDPAVRNFFAGFPGPATSPNRTVGRPKAAAALLPNTPQLTLAAGTWRLRLAAVELEVNEDGDVVHRPIFGALRVGVLVREIPAPDRGRLDLSLWFEEASGLTARTAQEDPQVQATLAEVERILGDVGVSLGDVSYHDLPSRLPNPLDLGGPSCLGGDVPAAFDALPPVSEGLPVIFVDRFTCLRFDGLLDVGAGLAALSNGLPVVPFAGRDGVLVATSLRETYPADWTRVLAHELGHALGLFHTVEPVGAFADNIADTPEGDEAEANLMYFNVSDITRSALTADQGAVVRLHPWIEPL